MDSQGLDLVHGIMSLTWDLRLLSDGLGTNDLRLRGHGLEMIYFDIVTYRQMMNLLSGE